VISKLEDIGIKTLTGVDIDKEIKDYHTTLLREIRENKKQDDETNSDEDAIPEFGGLPLPDDNTGIDGNFNDSDEEEDEDDYPMDIN
jgi:hypothetical protein